MASTEDQQSGTDQTTTEQTSTEQTTTEQTSSGPGTDPTFAEHADAQPAAAEPAQATKRAPRKSSRKASAPLPAAVADPFALDLTPSAPAIPTTDAGAPAAAAGDERADDAPPPAKRARKAAKRPSSRAAAGTDDLSVVPSGPVPAAADATEAVRADDLAAGGQPEPSTDSAGRHGGDAAGRDGGVAAAEDSRDTLEQAPGGSGSAAIDPESAASGDSAQDGTNPDDAADAARLAPGGLPSGVGRGAAPGFGVLFRAPEPAAVPRRRRASSPVAAPQARPLETDSAGVSEPGAQDDADQRDDVEAQPVVDAPTRGGRSRRGPDQRDDDSDDQTPVGDSSDDSDDGATDGSADGSGEGRRRRRRGGKGRRGRSSSDASDAADSDAGNDSDDRDTDTDTDDTRGDDQQADAGRRSSADQDRSDAGQDDDEQDDDSEAGRSGTSRRRTRRRRRGVGGDVAADAPPARAREQREPRTADAGERSARDEVTSVRGSTRLEAKKQRRREGREAGRRRTVITEAEFLARRESVERVMVVRHQDDRTQIGVLEDGILVEHYVSRETNASMAGNVYLGRVQNVLPSMEAAFIDVGRGRNAVLYAGEVNWDAAGLDPNRPRRIEHALKSGDSVLVQVTKDPMGHKGARLTSQISLPGRYLVYVPGANMTGISRKLPDTERARLKRILREVVPDNAGVIVRTAAEGASEDELRADVTRLTAAWDDIQARAKTLNAPALVHGEPDLTVRVIRDVFNEDFTSLVAAGEPAWDAVSGYVNAVAPDLADRLTRWTSEQDAFTHYRVDEQLAKALDRKVWLPSGGSLVIDRTEAMTVIDVNTGKFVGSGGNLEETVTKNNIEAAEEIVRQLRLRDIGGIIVIDFIDMVLESNRDLVVRRLTECLGRDRTKHQVAEVTSLGLVQMTRKRVGSGLLEIFSEPCEHCGGRGIIVHTDPVDKPSGDEVDFNQGNPSGRGSNARGRRTRGQAPSQGSGQGSAQGSGQGSSSGQGTSAVGPPVSSGPTAAQIAAKAHAAAIHAAAQSLASQHGGSAGLSEAGEVSDVSDVTEPLDVTLEDDAVAVDQPDQGDAAAEDGLTYLGDVTVAASEPEPTEGTPVGESAPAPEPEPSPSVEDSSPAPTTDAAGDDTGAQPALDEAVGAASAEADPVAADPTLAAATTASAAAPTSVQQTRTDPAPASLDGQDGSTSANGAGAPAGHSTEPPARGRRRRGRVVAPAGPPRPHPEDTGAGSAQGSGDGRGFVPDGAEPVG